MRRDEIEQEVVERFLRYVKIDTRSDEHVGTKPTTPGQWDLLNLLMEELSGLGIEDTEITPDGFIIARIPSTMKDGRVPPTIGFMAHVDTSPDVSGKDVKPQLIREYDGKDIRLNDELVLTVAENPHLLDYVGETVITTDGTTLLGADDKAGVAEIMSAASYYMSHPEVEHGEIELIFTADEETGHGMDGFPMEKLHARCCYTMDGGRLGEIEYESFNAMRVELEFTGVMIHPGAARGRMINAMTMASRFMGMLPQSESPETTDGREGYYYPNEIKGDAEHCRLIVNLRDFDADGMKRRVSFLEDLCRVIEESFGGGTVTMEAVKQYLNMREYIEKDPIVMEKLSGALETLGIETVMKPIRGGTDGSRLSEMGIPAPNIFGGGLNFHSRLEWAAVPAMSAAVTVIDELIRSWSREG